MYKRERSNERFYRRAHKFCKYSSLTTLGLLIIEAGGPPLALTFPILYGMHLKLEKSKKDTQDKLNVMKKRNPCLERNFSH